MPTRETLKARVSDVPSRFAPVDGSVVISDRLSRSSTKYGPSVSDGVTTHAGIAVAVVVDEGVGEGELSEAEGLRPVHAAMITPKPKSMVRRETTASNIGSDEFTARTASNRTTTSLQEAENETGCD